MALEDFERELAASKAEKEHKRRHRSRSRSRDRERGEHKHRHRRHHHRSSKQDDLGGGEHRDHRDSHRHKRSRRGREDDEKEREVAEDREGADLASEDDEWVEKGAEHSLDKLAADTQHPSIKRDSWMEAPSALDFDYVQKKQPPSSPKGKVEDKPKRVIHRNELNHLLEDYDNAEMDYSKIEAHPQAKVPHEVTYSFGDAGASWRMTKLRATYRQAEQSGKSIEDVAIDRYGDLQSFDDAREEEIELDRRRMYGNNYTGKDKPTGELFEARKADANLPRENLADQNDDDSEDAHSDMRMEAGVQEAADQMDQSALNKLKAQLMRAKLKGDPNVANLEAEYTRATANQSKTSDFVVLNKMENRMLVGGRKGEVNHLTNKRGLERGLVEENEDMSIEDMVRQERRTKGTQFSNAGKEFAERIAKDSKFDADLDYLDENASKLAKNVQKSDVNLRNTAIENYQKTQRALASCPLCHHEDTNTPPQAPIVSLATRTYLTLPTSPEISPYSLGATIVPVQHRFNLLECDDDEWEEIRNFMKSVTRFYHAQSPPLGVIFYENAANQSRKRHASMEAVPLPQHLAATAPAFFKEAILASDEEWTQHKKLIDTLAKATGGMGKTAFRRSMVSELPYFHVWFALDGGMGHVVEDGGRWPKGDLFAREVIGGMLDVGGDVINKQGRWKKGDAEMETRVKRFKRGWATWDWTKILLQEAS